MAVENKDLVIYYVESETPNGEYCTIMGRYRHRGDPATMRFYAAIGKQGGLWFDEYLHNYRDIEVPAHLDWTTVGVGVNIYITGLDPGSYDVYGKLSGPGPNLITNTLLDAFRVPGAPEEPEPPPEEPGGEVLVDSFNFTIPVTPEEEPPEEPGSDILVASKDFFIESTGEEVPPEEPGVPGEWVDWSKYNWLAPVGMLAALILLWPSKKKEPAKAKTPAKNEK